MAMIVIGILIFPAIIYFIVLDAVEKGVYNALIQYNKDKNGEQN